MKIIINSIVRDVSMSHYCNKENFLKILKYFDNEKIKIKVLSINNINCTFKIIYKNKYIQIVYIKYYVIHSEFEICNGIKELIKNGEKYIKKEFSMKLFSKKSKYNDTDSINNLLKNKAKFNSFYGKSFDEYKKLEEDLEIRQNNVSKLLIQLSECKEKLWKAEQKNQIIQSKNRVIKAIEDYIVEKMYFNVDLIKVYLELIKE